MGGEDYPLNEAEDPYNTTKLCNIKKTMLAFADDEKASSLGGFAETDSQAYRTDAVSKFVDD